MFDETYVNEVSKDLKGEVVHTHVDGDTTYQVEKLDPPVLRGAGLRHYRLWANGLPCQGRQFQYDLPAALQNIEFMVKRGHHERVRMLESRISQLTRSARMTNKLLADGTMEGLRANDVWFEIKRLVHMEKDGINVEEIDGQRKRIRLMLIWLETA